MAGDLHNAFKKKETLSKLVIPLSKGYMYHHLKAYPQNASEDFFLNKSEGNT